MTDTAQGTERPRPIVHPLPSSTTVKQLYGTAFRCAKPDCSKPLYRMNNETGETILNSRVAHIHARRQGGPRWKDGMPSEENRSADNLLLLCEEHAFEIDGTSEHYPPELLHEWKELQLGEHREQPTRTWPLSDEEAREVAEVSFTPHELGVAHAAASTVVNLARAVGQLIETARHEREAAQRASTAWQGLRRQANDRMPIYSADTGERLTVEPSHYETVPYRQALLEALQNAVNILRPLAIAVVAELHAISAVEQRLAPWCQWVERAAGGVIEAASRWPAPGHADDNEVLVEAITELQRASATLSAAWRREEAEAPPAPLIAEEDVESESQRLAREHRELLDSARPWSRVDTRPFDAELYQRLQAAAPYAATLPEIMSFLSWSLSTTAGLAAAVARNADDATFARLIDEAAGQQPLAVAAHQLRELMLIAREAERVELADAAAARVSQLLQSQSWQEPQLWADNELHMKHLLGWTAHLSSNGNIGALVATALAADPGLLPYILRGIAHWSEERDINTMQFMGIDCNLRELPAWLPVDQVIAEIRQQMPDLQPARYEGVQTEADVVRHLASQLLRLAAGGT
jgi:hypothetical protein